MSPSNESNGRVEHTEEGSSVLAKLPRTRPQRATARRAAARRGGEAELAVKTTVEKPPARAKPAVSSRPARSRAKPAPTKRAVPPSRQRAAGRAGEPVPRQGFESEGDRASGPVSPPGGIELLASAGELLGELAKAGVNTGERLLRDVLSRLPGT